MNKQTGAEGYFPSNEAYEYGCYEADNAQVVKGSAETLANELISMLKINDDITAPTLQVEYFPTDITNQDVIAIITSDEEIQDIEGWSLSENKKILSKTYTANKTENIEVVDLAGNITIAAIDIKNIDKQKPIAEVKYSKAEQLLDSVIVAIEANEELQEVDGWLLSNDRKTLRKTYTQYGKETVIIHDLAGNSTNVLIEPKKLDKIELTAKPTKINYIQNYETLDLTGGVLTVTYNGNIEYTINLTNANVKVTGFDNSKVGKNTITIEYQGKTAMFDVTIESKKLKEIKVTAKPTKTEYIEDENFNKSGMKVAAIYNDSTSKEITNYIVTDGNNLQVKKTSVTIKYTEGNITKIVTQKIKVLAKLKIEFIDYSEINKNKKKYIENIKPNTTLEELINKINTNGKMQIVKGNSEITNSKTKLSSGMKVKISLNNEALEYIIVVKGDTNGDGDCDLKDLLQVNKHRLNKIQLKNEYLLAGDVNNDNTVSIKDILQMNKFRLGKIQSL